MLQADGLAISLDMAALLGGEVKINAIEAIGPKIVLERSVKGEENWVFGGAAGGEVTPATPDVGAPFTIDQAVISDGALVFIDHATKKTTALSAINATVAIPNYTGAAQLNLTAVMNGQSFSAEMSVAKFQPFIDGKVVPVDLTLVVGAAKTSFSGRLGTRPLVAEGDISADLANLSDIMAFIGVAAPSLPEGFGARQIQVDGALTLTEDMAVYLRGGKVMLDGNSLGVEADLKTAGTRPNISAKVKAGALNFAGLVGGKGGGTGGGTAAAGWPKETIDASGLAAVDAAVAISADALDLGVVKFGATQAMITTDRGRAVFDIRKVAGYNGTIGGNFVVNARKGLSIGGDLSFENIALQPLLQDVGGYDRLIGTGDLRLKFLGVGNSVDAIMHSLEGSGSVALGQGELRGLDIAGMLRTLNTSYVGDGQKTIFDGLSGSFSMAGGVLHNEDLALKSPYITAVGVGDVGLGARNLEYRIKASALADDTGAGGLTAPLLIKGSWADPKFSLDLQAIADEKLAEQKAKLEAALKVKEAELRAKAEAKAAKLEADARAKLKDELGIEQLDGESLEDAAKRRANEAIEDEARKALEKMLNGG